MSLAAADVVVLGCGPAGSATALALARKGVSVCLVAPPRPAAPAVGETLLPITATLLSELGIFDAFLAQGHQRALGTCSSWGSDDLGYHDFITSVHGCGWHLQRERFDAFLLNQAGAAGVVVLDGWHYERADSPQSRAHRLAIAAKGRAGHVDADYVVDATGHRALFSKSQGATRTHRDRLMFTYGFFESGPHASRERTAMIEAVETGWWYTTPLPNGRMAVAFAGEPAHIRNNGLGARARWMAQLIRTQHIATRLAGCRLQGDIVARIAPSALTEPAAGPSWFAVGDAASSYDPLSARGIHKALATAIEAADALTQTTDHHERTAHHYSDRVKADFTAYATERQHFYESETRWSQSAFWQTRTNERQLPS